MFVRFARRVNMSDAVSCTITHILLTWYVTMQAMKMLRTDLSAEGRLDVLERVMSYRGGLFIFSYLITTLFTLITQATHLRFIFLRFFFCL